MKPTHYIIFLFTIATFGQRSTTVSEFLESKLTEFHKTETVKGCLELILSHNLDTVLKKVPIGFPLEPQENGFVIKSLFGFRVDPFNQKVKFHKGIDIAAKVGTPIISTAYGIITNISESKTGYGNMVIIEHSYGFESLYAHLSQILVTKGERVIPGQTIGLMGESGRATGSHLHYEIHKNGVSLNPKNNILLKIKVVEKTTANLTVSETSDKPIQNHHAGYNP